MRYTKGEIIAGIFFKLHCTAQHIYNLLYLVDSDRGYVVHYIKLVLPGLRIIK